MRPTVRYPAFHAPWRVSPSSTVRPAPPPSYPSSQTDQRATEDGELYEMLKCFGIAHSTFSAHKALCDFVGVNFAFVLHAMNIYSFPPTPSVAEMRELRERLRASAVRYAVPPNRDSPSNIESAPPPPTVDGATLKLISQPHADGSTCMSAPRTGSPCLSCWHCVMCGAWLCRRFQRTCSSCLILCIVSISDSAGGGWAGPDAA